MDGETRRRRLTREALGAGGWKPRRMLEGLAIALAVLAVAALADAIVSPPGIAAPIAAHASQAPR